MKKTLLMLVVILVMFSCNKPGISDIGNITSGEVTPTETGIENKVSFNVWIEDPQVGDVVCCSIKASLNDFVWNDIFQVCITNVINDIPYSNHRVWAEIWTTME